MVLSMACTATAWAASDTYLALGADLKAEEMGTVLEFFGVGDISDCNVVYVTNADEHKYLDGYVSSAQIGNSALSSVLIEETGGSSIDVELHNINYCTEGMYQNALATAGVSGARVIVAGPYEISGTAALVGTIKAYEEMTGEAVGDEVIEGAVDEITTTGEIGEEVGDKGAVEEIIADLKDQLADNPDMSDGDLTQAIRDAADRAGIDLSDANIEKIKGMLQKLQGLDIDWDNIKQQSGELLNKLSNSGILDKIINWFKNLF